MALKLLNRVWAIKFTIDGELTIATEELRVSFNITKDSEPSNPNKGQITVYNLSPVTAGALEDGKNVKVFLYAGYGDKETKGLLFAGNVDKVTYGRDGTQLILTVEASDGGKALSEAKINKTFSGKTDLADVAQDIINEMISLGVSTVKNIKNKIRSLANAKGTKKTEKNGITLSEQASKALKRILKKMDLDYVVNNEELIVYDPEITGEAIIILTPENGLLGTPIKRDKGVEFQSLIIPGLFNIGDTVGIEAIGFGADYRIRKLDIVGDTHGGQWTIKGVAR